MKTYYDILVIGATVLGCSLAERYGENCVVIERGCVPAHEFSLTLRRDNNVYKAATESGKALYEEYCRRDAVDEHGIWPAAVSPIIAAKIGSCGADIYFSSAVTSLVYDGESYDVSFASFGITHSFKAGRVIDTTPEFASCGFFGIDIKDEAQISITFNAYDEELNTVSVACDSSDIAAARKLILNTYSDRKLTMLAFELDMKPNLEMTGGIWHPSTAYDGVIEAWDAGQRLNISGTVPTVVNADIDDGEFDVIVVGLGTAGAMAAITAAEKGLRVLGLENLSAMGGSGTLGGIMGYYYGLHGGRYWNLDNEASAELDDNFVKTRRIGIYQKLIKLEQTAAAYDVQLRYGAFVTSAITDGDRVCGVRYMYNGFTHIANSAYVIDSSADSIAAVSAGCEMQGGRDSDGRFQPFSSVYFRRGDDSSFGYGYCDNGAVNQYDPDAYGRAVIESAASYVHLRDSYKDRRYLGIAPLIGLREGLRIIGKETVSFERIANLDPHTKNIVYNGYYNLDNHGKDTALENRTYRDWVGICGLWGLNITIPVPMGALIPRRVKGLLSAGRNISCDHDVATGLRMKDDAHKSGEAAALIAWLSIRDGCEAHEVNSEELINELRASGCLGANESFRVNRQQGGIDWDTFKRTDEEIVEGLGSDRSGCYMWAAKLKGEEAVPLLTGLLDKPAPLSVNAALTLALIGNNSGVPVLMKAAVSTDGYTPDTSYMLNTMHSLSAIDALGRLRCEEAVDVLLGILNDDHIDSVEFKSCEMFMYRDDVRAQYALQLVCALCEIAQVSSRRDEIFSAVRAYLKDRSVEVSMLFTPSLKLDCTTTLRQMAGI